MRLVELLSRSEVSAETPTSRPAANVIFAEAGG